MINVTRSSPPTQPYRPDIDGLRAVSVIAIVLFHVNKTLVPGGFVGVDLFFVISGYLISLNIFQDLERGRFSLMDFYRRRVKRIVPAMLVVVTVTLVAAQLLLRPVDAELSAEAALWSVVSLANVYFWLYLDTTYFAPAASERPLLHLWSLGVEEQFYLLWPLLLLFVYGPLRTRAFFPVAGLVALGSFLFGEYFFQRSPSFVYYMLPSRAGELLVGAMVAFAVLRGAERRVPAAVVAPMAATGLLLLIASMVWLSDDQVFPGWRALPPTLGAAFLILAGHCGKTWPSRLLELRPLVWLGLISYSVYLWHWPLLAFLRYGQVEITMLTGAATLAVTVACAWLTYRYVERPARLSTASAARVAFRQYLVPGGALAVAAIGMMVIDGYGIRWLSDDYKTRLAAVRDQTRSARDYAYVCQRTRITLQDAEDDRCVVGRDSAAPPEVLLWGDSNAAHYVGMVGVFAQEAGFRFRNLAIESCPPINGDPVAFVPARYLADCRVSAEIVRPVVDKFDVLIISASWTRYQDRSEEFLGEFFETVRELVREGKLVVLIGKAPVIPRYDRRCPEKALSYPFLRCPRSTSPPLEEVSNINARIRDFADQTPNVEYFDVSPHLCPDGVCRAFTANGMPLYYNRSHLNMPGSWELGDQIVRREGVPFPFKAIAEWPHMKHHVGGESRAR